MATSLSINSSRNGSSNVRLRIRGSMWFRVIHDPPVDSLSTAFIAAGSSPARVPSTRPSAVARNVIAVIALLMLFIT